jgi:carbon monoxide dehydrogenase subunit G
VKIEGTRVFDAPRDTVWGVLNDPAQMASLMPGVESFEVKNDRQWVAKVKIPLGLGGLRMSINMDKVEETPPTYAKLAAKGNGVGAIMNMETEFHLDETAEGTSMRWAADVKIGGAVGGMGQRVLQPIINQQVGNVLDALDRQVQAARAGGGELKDAGPPAQTTPSPEPENGESGADEGISPLAKEGYSSDPQGPTQTT